MSNLSFKGNPLVSIVMNCYNGEKYLKEAIDSIYDQTYQNWEIIFLDNASTDNSSNIAQSYDSKLHYYYEEKTISLGAARNKAIIHCRGDYIAFLDVDDLWLPKKIEKQIDKISMKENNILCYSDGYLMYDDKKTKNKFSKDKNMHFSKGYIFDKLIISNFIYWQTVLINRKKMNSELRFNENFFYAEDHELLLRISLIGRATYTEDPLIYYRIHKKNMSHDFDLIIKESEAIFNLFGKQIIDKKINIRKGKALLYGSIILKLIYANKEYKKYINHLLYFPSVQNLLLYILIKLNLVKLLRILKK